ncbi:BCCT family transporter [Halodesulfovibrio marinisediminis]|uniref:Choline-glycine betaine transporter n=1 Tax=Halodesulfovibrio marinisediminis DSM 17456 TaxID=1121457 RepID=A0A1N6EDE0_9BACT|nr:BCCT family transporter [Halodesulfovibrio marinisediminis]SIN81039.1 Choline-glycine betaine transporter [Halodesulfovibrio marinisediminis DSM 17456]
MSGINSNDDRKKLNHYTFWPGFLLLTTGIVVGLFYTEYFVVLLSQIMDWIHYNFGWLEVALGLLIVIFTIGIAFSPIGDIRLGGKDAKPEFTYWQWFALSLCGCIGIGILFWAMGEPIFHMMQPPLSLHITPGSKDAGVFAIAQTTLHWTIAQYCFYTVCAVAIALVSYNRNYPLSVAAGMYALVPEKWRHIFSPAVHAICLFSLCCAIATSMGAGLMQIGSGTGRLFNYSPGPITWAAAAAVIIPIYVLSSYSGLKKGMSFLSSGTTRAFLLLMLFVLFSGPTLFILGIGVESFGYFVNNFFRNSTLLNTMQINDKWPMQWLVPYMEIFFIFAPLLGHFLARMGKGRTIRQFILMNVIPPTIFCHFWIATFGGTAIFFQWSGLVDVWAGIQKFGMESMVYILFSNFPFSDLLTGVFVVIIVFSFATMTDSLVATLAIISTRGLLVSEEPPKRLKIIWGIVVGLVAYVLCISGGIEPVRGLISLAGFPMMLFTFAMCVSIVKDGMHLLTQPNWLDNESETD